MNFPLRRKNRTDLPGTTLVVRSHRTLAVLLDRARPGDLLVIDQLDLGADTARALLDRRPGAVLNASAFISGRYANLGPRVLAEAGVPLYEARRADVLALRDGATLRLHEHTLHDGAVVVLDLDEVTPDQVRDRMAAAESGLAVQLESFAHAASELVRREEGLLLHGVGTPTLRTRTADRVVLVVGPAARAGDLRALRRFVRTTRPVVLAVDAGVRVAADEGLRPDAAVLSGADVVPDAALRRAREVVLAEPGPAALAQAERLNLPTSVVSSTVAPVDVAMLVAHANGARLVVPVGAPATLEELIDRDRTDQASTVLTRLRLGSRTVDARAVPSVRRGSRPWRPLVAVLVAVGAVAAFLTVAPTGRDLLDDVRGSLPDGWGNPTALDRERDRVVARDHEIRVLDRRARSAEGYTAATAPAVVRGTLSGRAVTLLALPGADPGTVAGITALVAAAGGHLTGTLGLTASAIAPEDQGLVDALSSQLLAQATDVRTAADASGYQRLGALLARAAGLPASAHLVQGPYDATAVGIVSGLGTAKMVTAQVTARAALTVVVTGPSGAGDDLLASLVTAYAGQVPTVLAGPSDDGVLGLVRAAKPTFSTVTGTGATPGRVAAVLALAGRTHGTSGAYGTGPGDEFPPLS